ncbi:MAG TPA: glycosyltransferase, partial [Sedimentisphaerales bacterium]|nr:glycosyltransferase [Sedimentisphaerales bacterium]
MPDLEKGKATICVVNYKTLDLTRLCLRSIRKYTDYPCEVLVIDNGSGDASLDYLRSLGWITLIERSSKDDPSGGHSHAAALDIGLAQCRTEYFVSMHSDTLVMCHGWLSELISRFNNDQRIACVGSGKLELEPAWRTWLKSITDYRSLQRRLLKTPDPIGKHRYYNRTICCLYRTDVLRTEGLSFLMDREKG